MYEKQTQHSTFLGRGCVRPFIVILVAYGNERILANPLKIYCKMLIVAVE